MGTEFDNSEEEHFVGMYLGVVVDNADPLRIGRVRVRVAGLVEPFSAWALPFGTVGGGIKGRGFYDPPDKEADVAVWFFQGDIDYPVYASAHWGKEELLTAVAAESDPEEAIKIKTYETARFQMVWDDRDADAGKRWYILDKETGDTIEISDADGINIKTKGAINVEATGGDVTIKSSATVSVDATTVDVAATTVNVESSNVNLGASGLLPTQGVVNGEAIDTLTGLPFWFLGSASATVKAKK